MQLEWLTSSELNTDYFEIQRLSSALGWARIGGVQASGESHDKLSYSFRDTVPETGQNLYRLKMVDLDTHFAYSKVANVSFENKSERFLYPNPFVDAVNLSAEMSDGNAVEIYNTSGQKVYHENNFPREGVSLKSLAPGIYTVRITKKDGHIFTEKLVKAR